MTSLRADRPTVTDRPRVEIDQDDDRVRDLVAALRPQVDWLSAPELTESVRAALDELGPVRVTTFVPILVERRLRDQRRGRYGGSAAGS